ncbi:MAG: AIPR family protein [Verrucomicrobiales bacterium]|nr:AIPR family protein [Verrucomicrobiales bacterium]
MSTERPIEIEHLPLRLHQDFDGLITPVTQADPDHVETNFCSRALAAFTIHRVTGCSLQDAADSLVDGGNDGGIDAVYYSANSNTLWCVQSKFTTDGKSEPGLHEVTRFSTGLDALLRGDFQELRGNPAWVAKLPYIEHLMNGGTLSVRAALVYSGIRLVSDDRRRLFESLKTRHSPDDEYFRFEAFNLTTVHDWIVGAAENRTVDEVALCIRKPGWLRKPHEVVYGLIPLADLVALCSIHGERIVASNIRRYKGSTEVNEEIASTIRDDPSSFLYLNNGLTAYCDRLEVRGTDRGNAEQKNIKAFGFSIVNGAQTLGTLSKTCTPGPAPEGLAFIRVISMERCDDDRAFAERITRCTNTQNEILARDYVALDPEQERIANQLSPSSITYHYKISDDAIPQDAFNFSILESTTAAACMLQGNSAPEFVTRILSNRKSLWDTEIPSGETISRYSRVFASSLSARSLWRAVQAQRIVLDKFREFARAEPARKAFFENGRWQILNLIFFRIKPESGDATSLSADEIAGFSDAALTVSEEVWSACRSLGHVSVAQGGGYTFPRHLRSVFCDPADCRRIRGEVLRNPNHQNAALPENESQIPNAEV